MGFAFPAIDGGDAGNDIDTGGEVALDEGCANLSRRWFIGKGRDNNEELGHAGILAAEGR